MIDFLSIIDDRLNIFMFKNLSLTFVPHNVAFEEYVDRFSFAQPRSLCLNKQRARTLSYLESAFEGLPVNLFSHKIDFFFNITLLILSFLKMKNVRANCERESSFLPFHRFLGSNKRCSSWNLLRWTFLSLKDC